MINRCPPSLRVGDYGNILIINADSNLKRLIGLALPGMEHFVQYSATLQMLCSTARI